MTTDSGATTLTEADVAKLLNRDLDISSADIRDTIMDYFTISNRPCDIDSESEDEAEDPDAFSSTSCDVGSGLASAADTDQLDEPELEAPLIRSCISEVQELMLKQVFLEEPLSQDKVVVENFIAGGCKCARRCHERLIVEEVVANRLQLAELDFYNSDHINLKNELIISQFSALCDSSNATSSSHKKPLARSKTRNTLMFHGHEVCLDVYLFVNGIGIKRYKLLKQRFLASGLQPRQHGNVDKPTKHAVNHADCENMLLFLKQFSEQFGLVLPGRVPGFKATDLILLPSSLSKREVHRKYCEACAAGSLKSFGYDTFRRIWKQALPNTVIQKPRSDLCSICQKNLTLMSAYRGLDDEAKLNHIRCSIEHLELVKQERQVYTDAIIEARQAVASLHSIRLGLNAPCANKVKLHISFDYAQQVHIPFDPQQPGEIYFLVPFKVGLFGVMNEAVNKQVTYVIPETVVVGKGSNAVTSYIDHYFDNFGLGECDLVVHADNCSGQNKNNFLMAYFMWRILTGRHKSITFSFLPVGHTKFSPDWAFGMMKRKLRHTKVSSLAELKQCFEDSSPISNVNIGCLTGTENGTVLVPVRDWKSFLSEKLSFRRITGIKNLHYFTLSLDHPGYVEVKENSRADAQRIFFCSVDQLTEEKPKEIVPDGMTLERKTYLFEKIRPFCSADNMDILCPKPSTEITETPVNSPTAAKRSHKDDEVAADVLELPPAKRRKPVCSYCKQEGHRNSVKRDGTFWCPQRFSN